MSAFEFPPMFAVKHVPMRDHLRALWRTGACSRAPAWLRRDGGHVGAVGV